MPRSALPPRSPSRLPTPLLAREEILIPGQHRWPRRAPSRFQFRPPQTHSVRRTPARLLAANHGRTVRAAPRRAAPSPRGHVARTRASRRRNQCPSRGGRRRRRVASSIRCQPTQQQTRSSIPAPGCRCHCAVHNQQTRARKDAGPSRSRAGAVSPSRACAPRRRASTFVDDVHPPCLYGSARRRRRARRGGPRC